MNKLACSILRSDCRKRFPFLFPFRLKIPPCGLISFSSRGWNLLVGGESTLRQQFGWILCSPIATAFNAAAFGTTEVGWALQQGGALSGRRGFFRGFECYRLWVLKKSRRLAG
jgi:hypothetical protein